MLVLRWAALPAMVIAMVMLFALVVPQVAHAQVSVGISVGFGPPELPPFYQPQATQPNLIWQPGYWAWSPAGYFWVPGTWVQAPQVGLLWTPGYWGWNNGSYNWNPGYWGQSVGYYGGINYGYGYYGNGYRGGRWHGNTFQYNTSVTNVNTSVMRNTYVDRGAYVNQNTLPRTAYNGGPHGINARPTSAQLAVAKQHHYPMTAAQNAHVSVAAQNRNYLATVNHGKPADLAVAKPLAPTHRPAGFTPVKPTDNVTPAQHAAPAQHTAPAQHAAPAQHTAPSQHAAPAQHTAPAQQHAAPTQHAPSQHPAPAKPRQSPQPV